MTPTCSTWRRLSPLLTLCALLACQRQAPTPPSLPALAAASAPAGVPAMQAATPAASTAPASAAVSWVDPEAPGPTPATGALDDTPQALLHEALAAWRADRPLLAILPNDKPKDPQDITVALKPVLVAAIGDDQRILVLTGEPADDEGQPAASHIDQGVVLTYGFRRRDGRWWRTGQPPTRTWTGFEGQAGTIRTIELAPRHPALVIENGSCWQGYCGGWLTLLGLDVDHVTPLADSLPMNSESSGATEGCGPFLEARPADAASVPKGLDPQNCFDIASQWHLEPSPDGDGSDFVIAFTGREIVADAKTHALSMHDVDETLVLRRHGDKLEPASGHDPTHSF